MMNINLDAFVKGNKIACYLQDWREIHNLIIYMLREKYIENYFYHN